MLTKSQPDTCSNNENILKLTKTKPAVDSDACKQLMLPYETHLATAQHSSADALNPLQNGHFESPSNTLLLPSVLLSPEQTSKTSQNFKIELKNALEPQANNQKIAEETVLKNGIKKTTTTIKKDLGAQSVTIDLSEPVNGVKTVKQLKWENGDISQMEAFNEKGELLKLVHNNRNYSLGQGEMLNMEVNDTKKGRTFVHYGYVRNKKGQNKLKLITVNYADGTKRKTKIYSSNVQKVIHHNAQNVSKFFKNAAKLFSKDF